MSHREGLPVALMEAMACGIPVICSNIRGNTDLIEDGLTGVISKNNPEKLAKKISYMCKNDSYNQKISNIALKKIENFDLKKVIEEMKSIYYL
jgi:glycosyltransferase EpsD